VSRRGLGIFGVITGALTIVLLLYGTFSLGFKDTSIGGFLAALGLIFAATD